MGYTSFDAIGGCVKSAVIINWSYALHITASFCAERSGVAESMPLGT